MRVTHSPWRRSSAGSRMRWRTPVALVRLEDLGRPVLRGLSVAMTKSTPAFRWNASHASTTSASSRARSVMTSVIAASVCRATLRAPLFDVLKPPFERANTAPLARMTPSMSASGATSAANSASCCGVGWGPRTRPVPPRSGVANVPSSRRKRRSTSRRRVSIARVPGAQSRRNSLVVDRRGRADAPRCAPRPQRGRGGADVLCEIRRRAVTTRPPDPSSRPARRCGRRSARPRSAASRGAAGAPSPIASWFPISTCTSFRPTVGDLLVGHGTRSSSHWGAPGERGRITMRSAKEPAVVRPQKKCRRHRARAEAIGDAREDVLQRAFPRPPELVRVAH